MVSRKSRAKAKLSTRMTGCSYSGCRAPRSARAARTSGGPAMHQVLGIATVIRARPAWFGYRSPGRAPEEEDKGEGRPGPARRQ